VTDARARRSKPDAAPQANIEAEIDRILMDSFPASDPPQWDSLAAARLASPRPPPDREPARRSRS
jgi:hypothetical protein